jgi:hypothetical protein
MKLKKTMIMAGLLGLAATGAYAQVYVCEPCPAGTYSDGKSTTCKPCPTGTYSDSTGQASCKPCPANSSSNVVGATSVSSCTCDEHYQLAGSSCIRCRTENYENFVRYGIPYTSQYRCKMSGTSCVLEGTTGDSCRYYSSGHINAGWYDCSRGSSAVSAATVACRDGGQY